jgi:hypothetical protein
MNADWEVKTGSSGSDEWGMFALIRKDQAAHLGGGAEIQDETDLDNRTAEVIQ